MQQRIDMGLNILDVLGKELTDREIGFSNSKRGFCSIQPNGLPSVRALRLFSQTNRQVTRAHKSCRSRA